MHWATQYEKPEVPRPPPAAGPRGALFRSPFDHRRLTGVDQY
jgi:hypothetical protein